MWFHATFKNGLLLQQTIILIMSLITFVSRDLVICVGSLLFSNKKIIIPSYDSTHM